MCTCWLFFAWLTCLFTFLSSFPPFATWWVSACKPLLYLLIYCLEKPAMKEHIWYSSHWYFFVIPFLSPITEDWLIFNYILNVQLKCKYIKLRNESKLTKSKLCSSQPQSKFPAFVLNGPGRCACVYQACLHFRRLLHPSSSSFLVSFSYSFACPSRTSESHSWF